MSLSVGFFALQYDRIYCGIYPLPAIRAGTATRDYMEGADWYLVKYGCLPEKYFTKKEAEAAGWMREKGNLAEAAPGRMIGGNVYRNKDGKLPSAPNRTWYEADVDYVKGYRTNARIVYSNDGLVFVTYNHYLPFCEVVGEDGWDG